VFAASTESTFSYAPMRPSGETVAAKDSAGQRAHRASVASTGIPLSLLRNGSRQGAPRRVSAAGDATKLRRDRLRDEAATIVFAVYAIAAVPLIIFGIGRHRWFFGDEWSFLAERDGGNLGDLFRSHAEHWSTIPVLVYRALFNLFGLHTYVPYQAAVVGAHIATAILLRVVMRRAGVRPWTATVVASGFVLFGPGQENILWAFQIGFVGALMFGLVQLVLADHDGPLGRRDVAGLVAGALGLMCSGVSLPMAAVVGLATLTRRGWNAAAFHVLPLVALYGTWYLATSPGGIPNPYGRIANAHEIVRFVWSGIRGTFVALGAFAPIGLLLAVVFVVGARLGWIDARPHRRLVAPAALLVGALIFLVGTSVTRWFVTPTADSQSRYIYTIAALVLPALAITVDAVIMRWRLLAPVILGVLLVATVKNATDFNSAPFTSAYFREQKQLVLSMSRADIATRVPGYVRPNPWYTIGWLHQAAVDGEVPRPGPVSPALARHIRYLLSVAQIDGRPPDQECRTFSNGTTLQPRRGARFGFGFAAKPKVGANYFVQSTVVATFLSSDGRPLDSTAFKSDFGRILEIELDGLTIRLRAADSHQPLVLCTR